MNTTPIVTVDFVVPITYVDYTIGVVTLVGGDAPIVFVDEA